MPPKKKTTKSQLRTESSREIVAQKTQYELPDKHFSHEVPAAEFFAMLDKIVSKRFGPCEEGYSRNITWQSNPDRGVIELQIIDSPLQRDENETVQ